jgi:hypothetical protein
MPAKDSACLIAARATIVALTVCFASSADSRIRCEGASQVNSGQNIATPYCEDNYLAEVARSYGAKVSGDAVRRSSQVKAELCRFIGEDIRVKDTCAGFRDNGRQR